MDPFEKDFLPSQWTVRCDPSQVVEQFVKTCLDCTERVRNNIPCELGIKYGFNKPRETLDVYGTDLPDDSPIFMYVSGGYWVEGGSMVAGTIVQPVYESSVKTIVVDYERAPGVSLTDIVEEIIKSAQWVVDYAKQKKSRAIVISGHSVGAQLVCMILSSNWFSQLSHQTRLLFTGVVHTGGVFDVTPLTKTTIVDELKMTFQEAQELSPIYPKNLEMTAKNSANLETYIVFGKNEAPGLQRQGLQYFEALKEKGLKNNVHLIRLPEEDHFDMIEKLAEKNYIITKKVIELCHK